MNILRAFAIPLAAAALVLPAIAPNTAAAVDPIQPGDRVVIGDSQCTLNFVFDGLYAKKGKVYVGTAAHCTGKAGQSASTTGASTFGYVRYRGDWDGEDKNGIPGIQPDFALIEVKSTHVAKVKAAVIGWPGTPNGYTTPSETTVGDVVMFSGYGMVFSTTSVTRESRVGVLTYDDSTTYRLEGPIIFGDSGGPVLHESGQALGVVNHISVGCCASGGILVFDEGVTVQGAMADAGAHGYPVKLRKA